MGVACVETGPDTELVNEALEASFAVEVDDGRTDDAKNIEGTDPDDETAFESELN